MKLFSIVYVHVANNIFCHTQIPLPVATENKEEEANQESTASSLNLLDVRKRLDKLKMKT